MLLAANKVVARIFNGSILFNSIWFFSNKVKGKLNSVIPLKFTLEKDEIFRFPQAYREFKVLSGIAWVTLEGRDLILHSGEKAALESNIDRAIISALGQMPLVLEIF